ncbi:MAG: tetratricopeptide repeat protein [Rhodospirillales bacterium]|nr:tetratricopeptide repeat protein [Rhodospirillales bacterium]
MSIRDYRQRRRQDIRQKQYLCSLSATAKSFFNGQSKAFMKLQECYEGNGLQSAYQLYQEQNLHRNPKNRTYMGSLLFRNGSAKDAEAIFRQHVDLTPDDLKARQTLGDIYRVLGQDRNAETQYKSILDMEPHDAYALNSLGNLEMQRGNFDKAESYLQTTLQHHPHDSYALNSLGNLEIRRGNFDKAESYLQTTLKHHPNDSYALNSLGNLEMQRGNFDKAESHLQTTLQHHPHDSPAYYGLAKVAWLKNDKSTCQKIIREQMQNNRASIPQIILFLACKFEQEPLLPILKEQYGENRIACMLKLAHCFENDRFAERTWPTMLNPLYAHPELYNPVNGCTVLEMSDVPNGIRQATAQTVILRHEAKDCAL